MTFLETSDGLIAASAIICIGPTETWPHGMFHKILYRVGTEAWETRADWEDVADLLDAQGDK